MGQAILRKERRVRNEPPDISRYLKAFPQKMLHRYSLPKLGSENIKSKLREAKILAKVLADGGEKAKANPELTGENR